MQALLGNIRYGLRQLKNSPTFTIVAVLTLALGVGANTAIFSVVQAVLLHPAGITQPERVVSLHARYTQLNMPSIGVSVPDFKDAQSLTGIVDAAALSVGASFNTATNGGTEHIQAATVSHDWFRVFGAQPILGRVFAPEEDQKGANYVAVLSYAAWQRIFGGQRDAIGKSMVMDGQTYRVIGVMRSDFDWPRNRDVWVPLGLAPDAYAPGNRFNENYDSAVRLKSGVSVEQFNAALAQKRMEEIRREGGGNSFAQTSGWGMFAQPWTKDAAGDLRMPLLALFIVVAAILLIACANVAGLLLARTAGRMRELAIRTALGASMLQITSQFLVETLLLAVGAAIIAVLTGPLIGRLLLLAIPSHLADGFVVQSNPRLVAATIGFSLLAALLAGIIPAIQVARMQRVGEFGRSVTGSASRQRLRTILVSTEIALAFVLLTGTGMFLVSLRHLQQVDPGFRSEGVLTGLVTLTGTQYGGNKPKQSAFVRDVLSRIQQQPGVTAAAAISYVPFSNEGGSAASFTIQNKPMAKGEPGPHADLRATTAGYLASLQIPLMQGRWFTEGDHAETMPVAVIDNVLAKAYWPGQNPIGSFVRFGDHSSWKQIVGVVGHVRRDSLEVDENKGVIYMPLNQEPFSADIPLDQDPFSTVGFVVRTKGNPQALQSSLVRAVQSVDATEAIYDVHTLSSLVSQSLGARQLLVWLLSLFGGLALLLAAIGIYGLLSYTTSQRSAEIGIRMAMGAQRWQIARLIIKDMLAMVGAGLGVGIVVILLMQRLLAHTFAGLGGGVLPSLAIAAVGLLAAATLAVALPARKSASVDPAIVLRAE
ncbi:MAG TPA: ABC transporter permease [Edaphobacter sp.]|nr:ABC transporter permease [Edaphobacter sp.]